MGIWPDRKAVTLIPLPSALPQELLLAGVWMGLASGGVVMLVCGTELGCPSMEVDFGGGGCNLGPVSGAVLEAWAPVAFRKGTSCGGPMAEDGGWPVVGGGSVMVIGCGPSVSLASHSEILKRQSPGGSVKPPASCVHSLR